MGLSVSGEGLNREVLDWELFYSLAKMVAQKIRDSVYMPNFILGITPGGWVLGRTLGDLLDIKSMISLKEEHWGSLAAASEVRLRYPFRLDLTGRRVLVVDDLSDSEERINMALEYVMALNPQDVRTVTLRHVRGSKFIPDFYGDEVARRPAILPWSFNRDLRRIASELADECADLEELKIRLKRDYGIDVVGPRLSQILNDLYRPSRG